MSPHPVLAASAVVVRDGRLLVVQRGREPSSGLWTLPGGRVQFGERLAAAALRELAEETTLPGRVSEHLGYAEHVGAGHHFVIHSFAVTVPTDARANAASDAAAVRWVTAAQLLALPTTRDLLRTLEEWAVVAALTP